MKTFMHLIHQKYSLLTVLYFVIARQLPRAKKFAVLSGLDNLVSRASSIYLAFVISLHSLNASAEAIHVAVASNFLLPMKEIAARFEKATEHRIVISTGSSGKLYAQIINGAPYDIFFSADQSKPILLEQQGIALAGSRYTYAVGQLALWSISSDLSSRGVGVLHEAEFSHLAIANPKLAPYGKAAVEVLNALGLAEKLNKKLVMGENISQTFQFVYSKNAELGFVALSQILSKEKLTDDNVWLPPQNLYTPIFQDVVLLKKAQENQAVNTLLDFIKADSIKKLLADYGYGSGDNTRLELNE